ncbi:MAG TPA: acyltransferase family protein [Anaerolineales bacterium]|nr:acyltransferase family protein [Anaerolineales bacterium]
MKSTHNYLSWVEQLRSSAIIAVIVLHISAPVAMLSEAYSMEWWVGNVINWASRWCVPVFVLIYGYLAYRNPPIDVYSYYQKRFHRIFIPTLAWSIIFLAWFALFLTIKGEPFHFKQLLMLWLSGKPFYHLWYLYMLLSLEIFIPLMVFAFQKLNTTESVFFTILVVIYSAIASIYYDLSNGIFLFWFLPYLSYVMLGMTFARVEFHSKSLYLILGIVAIYLFGCLFLIPIKYGEINLRDWFFTYFSLPVFLIASGIFLLAKKSNLQSVQLVRVLSQASFGIYLVHPMWINVMSAFQIKAVNFIPLLSIPIISAICLALSTVSVWVIRKNKFTRQILLGESIT